VVHATETTSIGRGRVPEVTSHPRHVTPFGRRSLADGEISPR